MKPKVPFEVVLVVGFFAGALLAPLAPRPWVYASHLNGGVAVQVGPWCGGLEVYGSPGVFTGCDQ